MDRLLEWLFPATCPGCARPAPGFCPGCAGELGPPARLALDGMPVLCCGAYGGPLRRSILELKAGRSHLARALGSWMASVVREEAPGWLEGAVLVPVPAAPERLRWRGFHPAGLLAAALARHLGLACRPVLLCRPGTRPQKALPAAGRARNLQGAFRLAGPPPPRALLVDDVITTGETLRSCARLLRQGGCPGVRAVAAARQGAARDLLTCS
jgi:ComF family protein